MQLLNLLHGVTQTLCFESNSVVVLLCNNILAFAEVRFTRMLHDNKKTITFYELNESLTSR